MKKSLKGAIAALAFVPCVASAANLENPLYVPKTNEVYVKAGAGLMYKEADSSDAHKLNGRAGKTEWPIYRLNGKFGYGFNDRLSLNGEVAYTHDEDIDRKGLNSGRVGLGYRILNGEHTNGFILDVLAEAHLGGVHAMEGKGVLYGIDPVTGSPIVGFKYDNYTNGRYGAFLGAKFGKTWDKFTLAAFVEVQPTFGNHNNEIDVSMLNEFGEDAVLGNLAPLGITDIVTAGAFFTDCTSGSPTNPACAALTPAQFESLGAGLGLATLSNPMSVNLKSTIEFNAGLKAFYELNEKWSFGTGFEFRNRSANGVRSAHSKQNNAAATAVVEKLAAQMKDMKDGWQEYVVSASVSRQLTSSVQATVYGEYTFDSADANSQNGTDVKAEMGVRLNASF